MALKHETVDVRISQRILWFGSEAYPVLNITRTKTLKIEPDRGAAIKKYVFSVLLWVLFAGIVSSVAPTAAVVVVDVVVLAWLVVKTMRLVELLKIVLYELNIETAAGSHRGLVSDRSEVVFEIAGRITDAINNPHAEFQMKVENIHAGDNINFGTAQNVGSTVR
ncbi:MAG: DUF6232 family protein [Actinophytocola sp.]|uniref:DUF6232 family protein n=1 Tax=Actinophytocola sp. TaxID=1872138 RepID=UPI003D6ACC6C